METRGINQVGLRLGYLNSKKIEPSTKAIISQLDGADSVSLSNDHTTSSTDALSYINRSVYEKLAQRNSELNQKELTEINKKLLEKGNVEGASTQDKSYFNAENTAERIYNFATSFYETYLSTSGKTDSEESRKEYKEIIGEAIDDGFEQALSILGDLPDEVASEVQNTRDIIFKKLDSFVTGEEQSYSQKVNDKITNRVKELDKDESGDLSIEETNLSSDYFKELDGDQNGKLSIEELVNEYKKLDQTKDLSDDLVDSILSRSQTYEEVAKQVSESTAKIGLTFDFLAKNPKVAQAVIGFAGDGKVGSLAEYLEEHPEAVQKILEDPSNLTEVIRQYKLDAVIAQLQDSPITKDFLERHSEELDNLYSNQKLVDYFNSDKEAAERLVTTLDKAE